MFLHHLLYRTLTRSSERLVILLTPLPVFLVEVIHWDIFVVNDINRLIGIGDRNHSGVVIQEIDNFGIPYPTPVVNSAFGKSE